MKKLNKVKAILLEHDIKIVSVTIGDLNPAPYNPRKWTNKEIKDLTESVKRFGIVDPIIANSAKSRKNIVIGGHFRLKVAKDLGYKKVPVIYYDIPEIEKEQELNLRLNANTGEFDYELLCGIDQEILKDVGFDSASLDKLISNQIKDFNEPDIMTDFYRINMTFDVKDEFDKVNEWLEAQAQSLELKTGDKTKSMLFGKVILKIIEESK